VLSYTSFVGLAGVSRDNAGDPLPYCDVLVFRTSDNALIATKVSDGDGYYAVYIAPSAETYFVVSFNTDVAGVTARTLVAA